METVAFPLERGGQVLVRMDSADPFDGVVTRRARAESAISEAGQTFESALGTIRDVADAVLHQLVGVAVPPHEVKVEFALELGTKAAAIVASASATAQLRVTLAWNPTHGPTAQPTQK